VTPVTRGARRSAGTGWGRSSLVRGQSSTVLGLVGADRAGSFGDHSPARGVAAGRHEMAWGEGLGDPPPHFRFVGGLGCEEHSEANEVAVSLGGGVVRRQRAGWLMLPTAAQCQSDRSSRSTEILVPRHGQHGNRGRRGHASGGPYTPALVLAALRSAEPERVWAVGTAWPELAGVGSVIPVGVQVIDGDQGDPAGIDVFGFDRHEILSSSWAEGDPGISVGKGPEHRRLAVHRNDEGRPGGGGVVVGESWADQGVGGAVKPKVLGQLLRKVGQFDTGAFVVRGKEQGRNAQPPGPGAPVGVGQFQVPHVAAGGTPSVHPPQPSPSGLEPEDGKRETPEDVVALRPFLLKPPAVGEGLRGGGAWLHRSKVSRRGPEFAVAAGCDAHLFAEGRPVHGRPVHNPAAPRAQHRTGLRI